MSKFKNDRRKALSNYREKLKLKNFNLHMKSKKISINLNTKTTMKNFDLNDLNHIVSLRKGEKKESFYFTL